MIPRSLESKITSRLFSGKAIIIFGSRQAGKTTLLRNVMSSYEKQSLFINCDDPANQLILKDINLSRWKQIIGTKNLIILDEAQRIEDIGIKLKLVIDSLPEIQLIVSGSSSFDLANRTNEPLTGRKWEYQLYPISWKELVEWTGFLESRQQLEQRLIFGMYPEVVTHPETARERLSLLSGSLLYKDILSFRGIRKPQLLEDLLRALAFQLGNEVSYSELAKKLQVDKLTIMNYVSLLEQAFIIFRLRPLSRNLRKEISSKHKIYFFDNGIRNSLISSFNPLILRQDTGALWENFLMSERVKHLHYNSKNINTYFWRTHTQQEIDYVEEYDGSFHPYEFKFNPNKKARLPKAFAETYQSSDFRVIDNDNFEEFLLEDLVS